MTSMLANALAMRRADIIARRRAFMLSGYATLGEVGLDGEYVSPPQITSCSPDGPVLLAYHWLDAPTAIEHRDALKECGYLKGMVFNNVVDRALAIAGLKRSDIYITQAFHLLPSKRSGVIPLKDVDACFEQVTRHELQGRRVIALGGDAAAACRRAKIKVDREVPHPSARGLGVEMKALQLADVISFYRLS